MLNDDNTTEERFELTIYPEMYTITSIKINTSHTIHLLKTFIKDQPSEISGVRFVTNNMTTKDKTEQAPTSSCPSCKYRVFTHYKSCPRCGEDMPQ